MKLLALLPFLPLAGFLVNGLLGRRLPRPLVAAIGCGFPALAFLVAAGLWAGVRFPGTVLDARVVTWAATGGLDIDVAFHFDALTAVMALVVTGIGTLIHVYSIGYMADDRGFARYFAYLNLFLFFMLLLVLGSNLVVVFIGWEGVGLASYLLIGFWFDDPAKTAAGVKAFVVNRVGDTGFLAAAFLIQAQAGSLDFAAVNAFFAGGGASPAMTTTVALLLLLGACGKSAQIPLHVWLPDAMAGPTPVSALIHAATMVTAGVYLVARLNGLFLASPDAMAVVAWTGAATALVGAFMGTVQYNLKKVLAYSTMSQIGLMVMACGVGAFTSGVFHLYTHAFFKACLFLGAGAVLHALAGEEDLRRMGGLARRLPFTFGVFLVATLALCGVPPLAGFFSKDAILWAAWSAPGGSPALWAVGTVASFLTAFYMFRAIFLAFLGTDRTGIAHVHGPTLSMGGVLAILAAGSVVAGFVPVPEYLQRVLPATPLREGIAHEAESTFVAIAVAVAACGIAASWLRFGRAASDRALSPVAWVQALVGPRDRFDALYDRVVAAAGWLSAIPGRALETAAASLTLDAPARAGTRMARRLARLQTGDLQGYVVYALVGLAFLLGWGALHA